MVRLLREFMRGTVTDYQMSALLMAVFLRGLDRERQRRSPKPCWRAASAWISRGSPSSHRQAFDRWRGRQDFPGPAPLIASLGITVP